MTKLFKMTKTEYRQANLKFLEAKRTLEGLADEALIKMLEDGFDGLTPVKEVTEDMYNLGFKERYVAALKVDKDLEYIEEGSKLRVYTFQRLQNIFIANHTFYNYDNKESFITEDIRVANLDNSDNDFYIIDEKSNKAFILEEKSNRTLVAIQEELEKELLEKGYVDFNVWVEATEEQKESLKWKNLA